MDINEAIDSFFKLKNEYETLYHEKYVKPILNSNKSIKEKKSQFQKLPKAKHTLALSLIQHQSNRLRTPPFSALQHIT